MVVGNLSLGAVLQSSEWFPTCLCDVKRPGVGKGHRKGERKEGNRRKGEKHLADVKEDHILQGNITATATAHS